MKKVEISASGEEVIERLIARGVCENAQQVVEVSLRLLDDRRDQKLALLRQDVAVGAAAVKEGRIAPFDAEEIKKEGRKQHEQDHPSS